MRVCLFLDSFESGGIESFLTGVILHLPKDAEADIVAKQIFPSVFTDRLLERGVRFLELSGRAHSPLNARIFKRILRDGNYDAVHLNIFQAFDLRYAKIAKREGIPIRIAHAHGAGLRKSAALPIKIFIHRLSRHLAKHATVTLACSPQASKFLFGKGADKYIKNGIDTRDFVYSEEKRRKIRESLALGNRPIIGQVARLSSEKNQEFSLGVLREILTKRPDAVLLLVGDGDDRERLRELAARLNVEKSVVFYGTTSDVGELYSAMDIFLFPSHFEGFGIAAIEAQCAGLAVLCSRGVPSDAIICESAVRLPLADGEKKWADKILEMLAVSVERKSRCEEIIKAGYDIKATAREMAKYYENS